MINLLSRKNTSISKTLRYIRYENELKRYFFDSNPGLDRRFPWKYTLQKYNDDELTAIFEKHVEKGKWKLKKPKFVIEKLKPLMKENKELFVNNGGDVITFINTCKMAHSKRVFGKARNYKNKLTSVDIEKGMELYKRTKKGKLDGNKNMLSHMYL